MALIAGHPASPLAYGSPVFSHNVVARGFAMMARAWLIFGCLGLMLGEAHAARTLVLTMEPEAQAIIHVTSWFEEIPAGGYAPLDVMIENRSPNAGSWTVQTSSPAMDRETQMLSSMELKVEAGGKRTFKVLAPIRGGATGYGGALRLTFSGPGVSNGNSLTFNGKGHSPSPPTPYVAASDTFSTNGWSNLSSDLKTQSRELSGSLVHIGDMPEDWRALMGVRIFFIMANELQQLTPGQRLALQNWVACGGELAIFGTEEVPADFRKAGLGSVRAMAARLLGKADDLPELKAGLPEALGVMDSDQQDEWEKMSSIGKVRPNVPLLTLGMLIFAAFVGPVNLFIFAKHGRRARLFWTTPLISVAASAVLLVMIVLQDGFGGRGLRMALIYLQPERRMAAVVQEQVSRTGLLLGSSFQVSEQALVTPLLETMNHGRMLPRSGKAGTRLRLEGDRYSGEWFRSRAVQGHAIHAMVPTRAELTLVNGEASRNAGAAPVMNSSLDGTLREVHFRDRGGQLWFAKEIPKGVPVTLEKRPGAIAPGMAGEASPSLKWMDGRLRDHLPNDFFYAVTPDSKMLLETQRSIRWEDRPAVIVGPVTDLSSGAPTEVRP